MGPGNFRQEGQAIPPVRPRDPSLDLHTIDLGRSLVIRLKKNASPIRRIAGVMGVCTQRRERFTLGYREGHRRRDTCQSVSAILPITMARINPVAQSQGKSPV